MMYAMYLCIFKNIRKNWQNVSNFPDLRTDCKIFLSKSTNATNSVKRLAYSIRYNLKEVEEKAYQVIANNFGEVVETDEFYLLQFDELSKLMRLHGGKVRWIILTFELRVVHSVTTEFNHKQPNFHNPNSFITIEITTKNATWSSKINLTARDHEIVQTYGNKFVDRSTCFTLIHSVTGMVTRVKRENTDGWKNERTTAVGLHEKRLELV